MGEDERKIAAVDERTQILLKSVESLHEKFDNLDCKKHAEQIGSLKEETKETRDKKLDLRLSAIEKLFWPTVLTGVTSFVVAVFTVIKGHF